MVDVNERRKRIFEFIRDEEKKTGRGVVPSKISNRLNIPYYTVEIDCESMERDKILTKVVNGKFRYYSAVKEGFKKLGG